jgi:hypothetical protein
LVHCLGIHGGDEVTTAEDGEADFVAVLDVLLDVVAEEDDVALVVWVFCGRRLVAGLAEGLVEALSEDTGEGFNRYLKGKSAQSLRHYNGSRSGFRVRNAPSTAERAV